MSTRRTILVNQLDSLARLGPTDWVIGQAVNFAIKNAEYDRAKGITETCLGTPWWCDALRGYALHHVGSASEAGAYFDSVAAHAPRMSPAWATPPIAGSGDRGLLCEWSDISLLLHDALQEDYEPSCTRASAFEARFWWLADPLWSDAGNERWNEHIARNIQMKLRDELLRLRGRMANGTLFHHGQYENAQYIPWGFPNSWRPTGASHTSSRGISVERSITGEIASSTEAMREARGIQTVSNGRSLFREAYVHGGYSFTPDHGRFHDPMASDPDEWAVTWNEGRERMMTRETWYNLGHHQTAVLRRGDCLLAIMAAGLPVIESTTLGVEAALAMGRHSDMTVEVRRASVDPLGTVRASADLEEGEWPASIEIRGEGWVGRARYGAPAPALDGGFGISAPVLVSERMEEEALSPDAAILPTTILAARGAVGVYFEVYGAHPGEQLDISISAERGSPSFVRRLWNALRFKTDSSSRTAWTEAAGNEATGHMARLLVVDLKSLESGEYRLVLRVSREDGSEASMLRSFRLTK